MDEVNKAPINLPVKRNFLVLSKKLEQKASISCNHTTFWLCSFFVLSSSSFVAELSCWGLTLRHPQDQLWAFYAWFSHHETAGNESYLLGMPRQGTNQFLILNQSQPWWKCTGHKGRIILLCFLTNTHSMVCMIIHYDWWHDLTYLNNVNTSWMLIIISVNLRLWDLSCLVRGLYDWFFWCTISYSNKIIEVLLFLVVQLPRVISLLF